MNNTMSKCPYCGGEPLTEPKPLSLDELRERDGKPVWIKELEEWAIVVIDTVGLYKGIPFVKGKLFEYNVARKQLTCYDRPPRREENA